MAQPQQLKKKCDSPLKTNDMWSLCFEGHRWFDLVRTGRINKVMEAHFNHRTQGLSATQQANNNGMAVKDCDATTGTPLEWRWSKITDDILFPDSF